MKIEIDRSRERPMLDRKERLIYIIETDFYVGDHGPFTVRIKKEEFTKERLKTEIEKVANVVKETISELET